MIHSSKSRLFTNPSTCSPENTLLYNLELFLSKLSTQLSNSKAQSKKKSIFLIVNKRLSECSCTVQQLSELTISSINNPSKLTISSVTSLEQIICFDTKLSHPNFQQQITLELLQTNGSEMWSSEPSTNVLEFSFSFSLIQYNPFWTHNVNTDSTFLSQILYHTNYIINGNFNLLHNLLLRVYYT